MADSQPDIEEDHSDISDGEEVVGRSKRKRAIKLDDEEEWESEEESGTEDEQEGSEESGDEAEGSGDDSEEGSDTESEDENVGEDTMDMSSEESDGESEKCPVCLGKFKDQDVGTPESCDHTFCLECIQEWSKNVNTCPVDRQVFHLIFVRNSLGGKIIRKIEVEDRQLAEEEEEDPTDCEVCGRSDREDRLLLCDGCDLGYHCECLEPPVGDIPVDEWFCPDCSRDRNEEAAADVSLAEAVDDDEEIAYLINENRDNIGLGGLRPQRRQVARTRQSERVRAAIETLRERRRRVRPIISSSESSAEEDDYDDRPTTSSTAGAWAVTTGAGATSALPKKRAPVRRKRKATKRKTTKRKGTKKRKSTAKKTTATKGKKKKKED